MFKKLLNIFKPKQSLEEMNQQTIDTFIRDGKKVEAIKFHREVSKNHGTPCELREAKHVIDKRETELLKQELYPNESF